MQVRISEDDLKCKSLFIHNGDDHDLVFVRGKYSTKTFDWLYVEQSGEVERIAVMTRPKGFGFTWTIHRVLVEID